MRRQWKTEMFKHLLVPLDDSLLSVDTVRKAVEFARDAKARITFFHAQEDYGATSVGALQRVMSPAAFNEHMAGEARAILAKAEAVARTAGVPFESLTVRSDRAYEAILEAARTRGCDLIFIASHGRRGLKSLVLGSQTERVLQQTTLPVLVSAVESNLPKDAMRAPLAIIGDEHRSLAAVIHGLEFLVRTTRQTGAAPSFALLGAMLHYIREFPEALHHPKEEAYLFRKLAERTREFDATLEALERQHAGGHDLVIELEESLTAYEGEPAHGFERFALAVARFAAAQMEHMALETKVILPAAREHLTEADWNEIGAAFAGNGDPRFSDDNDEEFRQLFARILNHAPAAMVGGAAAR
jgi:nucleotide-binding universal stress UspA family protein/hemerythrin-like domain-containing protein